MPQLHADHLQALLDPSPIGMLLISKAGRILAANKRIAKLLKWESQENMVNLRINTLIPKHQRAAHDQDLDEYHRGCAKAREIGNHQPLRALAFDGSEIPVEIGLSPVDIEDQSYTLVSILNISEQIRTKELESSNIQTSVQAHTDVLMQLPNRTTLIEKLDDLIIHQPQPFSLAFLDLDGFKLANDQYGHLIGDGVLQRLSDLFRKTIRQSDMMGRLSGDTFLIIFPDLYSSESIRRILYTLLRSVETLNKLEGDSLNLNSLNLNSLKLSLSIGALSYEKVVGLDSEAIISQADRLMYRAKKQGRNQIVYKQQ
ncbi:MAG: diguanylate cyclase (GGDEF)-like protein/PAS domain S-box-containing protein [Flavobacteriales bacterium]|jgi:diguanylate cyclase (GGDEF)-like protein/PAS domain S-box-containing protein